MGQLQIPGTSVQYSNPKQVNQSTNLDPTTGAAWNAAIQTYSFTVPASPPTFQVGNTPLTPGSQATTTAGGNPQPGSYDATPPQAPPLAINQDPPVAGKGKPISVSGTSGSTGNPTTDLVRKVVGQVPGSSVTISNPG